MYKWARTKNKNRIIKNRIIKKKMNRKKKINRIKIKSDLALSGLLAYEFLINKLFEHQIGSGFQKAAIAIHSTTAYC